jgi:hypothetical protein
MIGPDIVHWLRTNFAGHIPKFIIYAPDYTTLSSGIRCLHLLCHRLNQRGFSAAITPRIRNPHLETPRISQRKIQSAPGILDLSIVIYPEVVKGNPLEARNVVRYLLNKPGFFGVGALQDYGPADYFIHFAEEFRPSGLKSRPLRLPLVDTNIFKPPLTEGVRRGFLLYSARYTPNRASFPDWIDDITVISSGHPRSPAELAELYGSKRALIIGERSAAAAEALHCHCPIIMLPHDDFDHVPFMSSFVGFGKIAGFDHAGLASATKTACLFQAQHAGAFVGLDHQITDFAEDAIRYFRI